MAPTWRHVTVTTPQMTGYSKIVCSKACSCQHQKRHQNVDLWIPLIQWIPLTKPPPPPPTYTHTHTNTHTNIHTHNVTVMGVPMSWRNNEYDEVLSKKTYVAVIWQIHSTVASINQFNGKITAISEQVTLRYNQWIGKCCTGFVATSLRTSSSAYVHNHVGIKLL